MNARRLLVKCLHLHRTTTERCFMTKAYKVKKKQEKRQTVHSHNQHLNTQNLQILSSRDLS